MTAPPTAAGGLVHGAVTVVDSPAPEDQRCHSVTHLIKKGQGNEGLQRWGMSATARAAVVERDIWLPMANRSEARAIEYLRGAAYHTPDGQRSATKLGTANHAAIEHKTIHRQWRPEDWGDAELRPFLEQWDRFLAAWRPRFIAAEMPVFHPDYRYAGTCDGILELYNATERRWRRLMFDIKTSRDNLDSDGRPKRPWADAALQVAAYRNAKFALAQARRFEPHGQRYYLLSDAEEANAQPMPEVDGGLVIFITPQRCDLYPVRCDDEVFEAFLYVAEAARFALDTAKHVIGNPMTPTTQPVGEDPQ